MAQWEAIYDSLVLWGKDIRHREGPISIQQKPIEIPGAVIMLSVGRGHLRGREDSCVRAVVQACLSQLRPWHSTAQTAQWVPHIPFIVFTGQSLILEREYCTL